VRGVGFLLAFRKEKQGEVWMQSQLNRRSVR